MDAAHRRRPALGGDFGGPAGPRPDDDFDAVEDPDYLEALQYLSAASRAPRDTRDQAVAR